MMATRKGPATGRTWLIRLAVAGVVGIALGAGVGVAGVNRLDPGRPGQADSLQIMLDSLAAQSEENDPIRARRAIDSADADRRARHRADSLALENDPLAPTVPEVVRLEEGAARSAIEAAGLSVGSVEFRASSDPAGTVLATRPIAGRKVRPSSAVDLVLSDGRTPPDTTDTLAVFSAPPRSP
jgi:hypothetical protein